MLEAIRKSLALIVDTDHAESRQSFREKMIAFRLKFTGNHFILKDQFLPFL